MSTALGGANIASGFASSAQGYSNSAEGQQSNAIGYQNTASGDYSTALGSESEATEEGALAAGNQAKSTVANGVALGSFSEADREVASADDVYMKESKEVKASIMGDLGAVSVGNATATRQIINLAAGTKDTDAVNIAQLKALSNKTDSRFEKMDQRFEKMDQRINKLDKHTQAVAAEAMATASLVPSTTAGKGNLSLGVGTQYGETGYAIGVSYRTAKGGMTYNLIGAGNSQGRFGAGASVNFHW
ncbi:YadA-like family protein [Taylorella equigenitalis]|nr:YadA-like family protein [Taylorella equigenitalis]WGQ24050.1 YadA-like family protein [Taylorella equigenitalis]